MVTTVLVIAAVVTVAIFLLSYYFYGRKPGPWGFPIVGHLPLLGKNPAETLMEWRRAYGPVYFIQFGSMPAVILHGGNIIKEMFSFTESSGLIDIYSANLVVRRRGLLNNEGPKAFEQRQFVQKIFKEIIGYTKFGTEARVQEDMSRVIDKFQILADTKSKFVSKHFFTVPILNSLWDVVIGSKFESDAKDCPANKLIGHLETLKKNKDAVSRLSVFVPWIDKLLCDCGMNAKTNAFRGIYDFVEGQIKQHKKTWTAGQPRDFTDNFFDKIAATSDPNSSFHSDQNYQKFTTGDLLLAGLETVGTSLEWLMLYMTTNLEAQKRLQDELDSVIDRRRPPSINDRPQLPFCEAIIYELLRLSSLVPFASFHRAMETFTFHGHEIEKGTLIIPNLYASHMDPNIWAKPKQFLPERFLDHGRFTRVIQESAFLPFGSGRRTCLGDVWAKDMLFLYCATIFQKFSIFPPPGGHGQLSLEPVFGFALSPKPFELVVVERPLS